MPEDLITSEATVKILENDDLIESIHRVIETDFSDPYNDKCPKPDRGETDTSDEVRDLAEF